MKPSFVVVTDLSPEAYRAAYFAALLAAAVGAELLLLYQDARPALEPEFGLPALPPDYLDQQQRDVAGALAELAQELPAPAAVQPLGGGLAGALQEVIRRRDPQLLVLGLAPEHDLIDQALYNYALPVLRDTRLPLLLVPAGAAHDPAVPRQIALAVDGAAFSLNAASRRLQALVQGLPLEYTVVHVAAPTDHGLDMRRALVLAGRGGLLPAAGAGPSTYQLRHASRSAGLVQAAVDTQADVLVLVARPRSFLARLLPCHLATAVARHCPVPLLLLPAEPEPTLAPVPTAVDGLWY